MQYLQNRDTVINANGVSKFLKWNKVKEIFFLKLHLRIIKRKATYRVSVVENKNENLNAETVEIQKVTKELQLAIRNAWFPKNLVEAKRKIMKEA